LETLIGVHGSAFTIKRGGIQDDRETASLIGDRVYEIVIRARITAPITPFVPGFNRDVQISLVLGARRLYAKKTEDVLIVCPRDRNVYASRCICESVIMVPDVVGDREIVGIYRRDDVSPVVGPLRHDAGYVDGISDI
jgi:hypothetical protein